MIRPDINTANPYELYWYAEGVIKDRWPEAEPFIAEFPDLANWYAKNIIKGKWPEGESGIAKDPGWTICYITDTIEQNCYWIKIL